MTDAAGSNPAQAADATGDFDYTKPVQAAMFGPDYYDNTPHKRLDASGFQKLVKCLFASSTTSERMT